MSSCKCGCGQASPSTNKAYVDKEHQLAHMYAGRARELQGMLPPEVKERAGRVAGQKAAESGRLAAAGLKGAARAREIAAQFRERRAGRAGSPNQK